MTDKKKEMPLSIALIPIAFLIVALSFVIIVFKQTPHITLICAAAVAAAIAAIRKHPWKEIQEGMVHGITLAMGAILILMIVGTMIGTWISGGIVPTMIFYGLKVLSPGIFLVATLLTLSVNERWGEIATLRALGVTRGRMLTQVAWQGLLISAAGTVIGLAMGLVVARYLDRILVAFPGLPVDVSFFVLERSDTALAVTMLVGTGLLAWLRRPDNRFT